jgi:hypothetical protein
VEPRVFVERGSETRDPFELASPKPARSRVTVPLHMPRRPDPAGGVFSE